MLTNHQVVLLVRFMGSNPFKSIEMDLSTRMKLKKFSASLKTQFEALVEAEKELKTEDAEFLEFKKALKEKIQHCVEKNPDGSIKETEEGRFHIIDGCIEEVTLLHREVEANYKEAVDLNNKKIHDWVDLLNMDSKIELQDLKMSDITVPSYLKLNSEQWEALELIFQE